METGTDGPPPWKTMSVEARDGHAAFVLGAFERFEGPLRHYATGLLGGDVERARDVVQETFLGLCRADRAVVESRLAPWLYAVCRNRAVDERRKERRVDRGPARTVDASDDSAVDAAGGRGSTATEPAEAVARAEAGRRVMEALSVLTPNQQEVFRLRFQHDLAYKEIAEVTGLTVSHIGVLLHEGMLALRRRFDGGAALPGRVRGEAR